MVPPVFLQCFDFVGGHSLFENLGYLFADILFKTDEESKLVGSRLAQVYVENVKMVVVVCHVPVRNGSPQCSKIYLVKLTFTDSRSE